MANYKVVDADKLDSDLALVADAIRAKAGTEDSLAFPDGMVEAVIGIQSGGGQVYVDEIVEVKVGDTISFSSLGEDCVMGTPIIDAYDCGENPNVISVDEWEVPEGLDVSGVEVGRTILTYEYWTDRAEGQENFQRVRHIQINVVGRTIQFEIEMDGETRTYYAEEGMTWGQWVGSEYNTDGFYRTAEYDLEYGYPDTVWYDTWYIDDGINSVIEEGGFYSMMFW